MRELWKYVITPEIVFGCGAVKRVGSIAGTLKVRKILIVTDEQLVAAGHVDMVRQSLGEAGIEAAVFDGATPEPSIEVCEECAKAMEGKDYDGIIGLGGGSNIDLAKTATVVHQFGGSPRDYFGESKVPAPIIPLIAISTTSGTGSEVSPVAVLTDVEQNLKVGMSDNYLRPRVGVFDPLLTISLPPVPTAHSGIDALCHAVESYVTVDHAYVECDEDTVIFNGRNPLTQTLAEQAIRLIGENLRTAVDQGANVEARKNMALAALIAGMAFTNSGVTIVHALAYPVGAITHASHGCCNGLLLPHVLEYNLPVRTEELARVATLLGEETFGLSQREAAERAVEAVMRLNQDIGMPSGLREIGITEKHLPEIAQNTIKIERLVRGNPRRVTVEALEDIARRAL